MSDFPLIDKKQIVYLDSAATAQKPQCVIDAITRFYSEQNANIHRGFYDLSIEATMAYERARERVASFINAPTKNVIFTAGTTDSLNMVAWGLDNLKEGDEILLTPQEHHANIVPWQEVAKKTDAKILFCDLKEDLTIDVDDLKKKIGERTRVLGITHVSNTLGTITPLSEIIPYAKEHGVFVVVDGAQAVPHLKVDVEALGCDAYAFSGHKVYGPTGIGVLYLKDLSLRPFRTGGDMINDVTEQRSDFVVGEPRRFEAGTPNIAGVIGLGAAITYLAGKGMAAVERQGNRILEKAWQMLARIEEVELIGKREGRVPVIAFSVKGVPPHDVAEILARDGICIRVGKHCTHPLHARLGLREGSCRVSFGLSNNEADVDRLVAGLQRVIEVFR